MSNVAVSPVGEINENVQVKKAQLEDAIKKTNVVDISAFDMLLDEQKADKDVNIKSIFSTLDKNNDGVLNIDEFYSIKEKNITKLFNNIITVEETENTSCANEFAKKHLEKQIEAKEEKILRLQAKKKSMDVKDFYLGMGIGAAIGCVAGIFLGLAPIMMGVGSIMGLLGMNLKINYYNKKIDAEIAKLNVEINALKTALKILS